jgi:hypothetical protein
MLLPIKDVKKSIESKSGHIITGNVLNLNYFRIKFLIKIWTTSLILIIICN